MRYREYGDWLIREQLKTVVIHSNRKSNWLNFGNAVSHQSTQSFVHIPPFKRVHHYMVSLHALKIFDQKFLKSMEMDLNLINHDSEGIKEYILGSARSGGADVAKGIL